MPSPQNVTTSAAYRPTSLDFINLPNPIEPNAGSQRHPLNGTPRLDNARLEKKPNQGLYQLYHDPAPSSTGSGTAGGERLGKRQKPSDNTLLDLPKLPVRHAAKRLRIPPTLSGLHQPPPDAGLLPSINIEKPRKSLSPRPSDLSTGVERSPKQAELVEGPDLAQIEKSANETPGDDRPEASGKRSRRTKWTAEETRCLLQGVARFGIGNWTKILNCPDLKFNHRTALDLKDRFRVCRPADYRPSAGDRRTAAAPDAPDDLNRGPRGHLLGHVSTSQLKKLGIDQPFTKSSRRQRHGYTRAEDEALLQGFRLYGNSWATIRCDISLGLSTRTATDLRDRFRTRYPEEYANAGLAVRQEKLTAKRSDPLPADADHDRDSNASTSKSNTTKKPSMPPASIALDDHDPITAAPKPAVINAIIKRPALFSLDDVFWGADCGIHQNVEEGEPIVLDRGILDWAANDGPKSGGIDPLMTLKLPKLTSSSQPFASGSGSLPETTALTSLPSLASMVASSNPTTEHQEPSGLPSIIQWLRSGENDGNPGPAAGDAQIQDE